MLKTMSRFIYTDEHLEFLRDGYLTMNTRSLARAFNDRFGMEKTEEAIGSALRKNAIRCGRAHKDRLINRERLFTAGQAQFIRGQYKGRSMAEMTALFNRRFGTGMTVKQIRTFVHNRGIKSGRTGHFPRGHRPWNAGTKGLTGPNKTSFKKGNAPPNRKPIGAERIGSKEGFILMKVPEPDPYTGFPTRYKHKHVYLWEQAHGPVPEGMVVAFVDGDKTRCDLDNLMLISRAELLNLNRHGYGDTPDSLKPSVLALSTLEVRTWKREKAGRLESMEAVSIEPHNLASMMDRAKLLAGPGYFTCERTHTRMKKIACMDRQRPYVAHGNTYEPPPECRDCPQGQEITALLKGEDRMEEQKTVAVKMCDEPGCMKPAKIKGKCKRHYQKTYFGKAYYAKRALRRRGKKLQKATGVKDLREDTKDTKDITGGKVTRPGPWPEPPEEEIRDNGPALTLQFDQHPDLYEKLETKAAAELRTPELQALYFIREALQSHDQ